MHYRTLSIALGSLLVSACPAQFTEHVIDSTEVVEPRGISAADLDGDGDNDVAVMSFDFLDAGSSKLCWYANDGTGQFSARQVIDTGDAGEQPELVDLDGDGDIDILAAWNFGQHYRRYLNDGMGHFSSATWVLAVPNIYHYGFLAADITGDGRADCLVGSDYDVMRYAANDGSGGFLPQQLLPTAVPITDPVSIRACDVDGDGDPDLVFGGYVNGTLEVAWLEDLGGGQFGAAHPIASPITAGVLRPVDCNDLDGDGDPDVAYVSSGSLAWRENTGSGYADVHAIAGSASSISMLRSADLDGDGDQDLIAARLHDRTIEWYANNGNGDFAPAQIISSTCDSLWWITTADMNGDGIADVISSSMRGSVVSWYELDQLSTGIPGPDPARARLSAVPCPFTSSTTITSDTPLTPSDRIRLFDLRGRAVRSWNGNGTRQFIIDRGDLPAGVYWLNADLDGRPADGVEVVVQ